MPGSLSNACKNFWGSTLYWQNYHQFKPSLSVQGDIVSTKIILLKLFGSPVNLNVPKVTLTNLFWHMPFSILDFCWWAISLSSLVPLLFNLEDLQDIPLKCLEELFSDWMVFWSFTSESYEILTKILQSQSWFHLYSMFSWQCLLSGVVENFQSNQIFLLCV